MLCFRFLLRNTKETLLYLYLCNLSNMNEIRSGCLCEIRSHWWIFKSACNVTVGDVRARLPVDFHMLAHFWKAISCGLFSASLLFLEFYWIPPTNPSEQTLLGIVIHKWTFDKFQFLYGSTLWKYIPYPYTGLPTGPPLFQWNKTSKAYRLPHLLWLVLYTAITFYQPHRWKM